MIDCIIIEDQLPAQRILKKYISEITELNLVGTYSNALSAEEALNTLKIALIFLDIHLPKISGIDFLKSIEMIAFKLYPEGDGLDNDGDGIWDNEGELVWREQVDNEVFSSPSIHNGNIYFGTGQYNYGGSPGSVYALRETDGAEIWRYQNSDGFLSSALVADNKVYIGSNDENLYAFFEENGTVKWSYNAQGGSRNAIGSSPSLYKGRVVVGSCNGMVYSFREDNVAPFVIPLFPFLLHIFE